jgi:hypothetical protein
MRMWIIAATIAAGGCYQTSTSRSAPPTAPPASPDAGAAEAIGSRFAAAIQARDEASLQLLLAPPLRIALEGHRCERFNDGLSQVPGVAACLATLRGELLPDVRPHVIPTSTGYVVELAGECTTYSLALGRKRDGSLRVASLASELTCDGVVGGMYDPSAPPPPPPPPPPSGSAQTVPPTLLEGHRIAGTRAIAPDDRTKIAIARSGKDRLIGSLKLCVNALGEITVVSLLKSTGFPDYDAKLERGMREWRYSPYEVNGKPVPVCTAITFIYKQDLPPPPSRGAP